MTLTLGERSGSMTQVWSVDVGMVSNMQRQNVLGTGSASMTLQGVNLARLSYTSQVRQGRSGCEGTSWESDTSVRCLVGHGIRGTLRLVMTVGERGGSVTQVWSVDMPGVSVVRRENWVGMGMLSVTVHGGSMGSTEFSGRVREGHTNCESTEWESDSSVRCLSGQGTQRSKRAVVTIG